jgi:hypothetical protein
MRRIVYCANIVTANMADEAIRLNTVLVDYIKDCLLVYINSFNLAIQYSDEKTDVLSSFNKFITKANTGIGDLK